MTTVALARHPVDVRAAGERQPEHPGDLVERLARGVVDRRPEAAHVVRDVGDEQERGVPARDEQRQRRLGQRTVLDDVDGDVAGEVVHAVERHAEREGAAPSPTATPTMQRAGQPRARRDRHGVEVAQANARRRAGPLDRRDHRLEVGPARHLGHDPAEPRVLVDAARDGVDEQGLAADDADAGLVARRLDAEHEWLVTHRRRPPPPATSAARARRRPPAGSSGGACVTHGVPAALVEGRAPASLSARTSSMTDAAPRPRARALELVEQHPTRARGPAPRGDRDGHDVGDLATVVEARRTRRTARGAGQRRRTRGADGRRARPTRSARTRRRRRTARPRAPRAPAMSVQRTSRSVGGHRRSRRHPARRSCSASGRRRYSGSTGSPLHRRRPGARATRGEPAGGRRRGAVEPPRGKRSGYSTGPRPPSAGPRTSSASSAGRSTAGP